MDPLTELLTGLGRHYGLVLVGCAELIAALFLLGWRPRERRGRERLTAVSSVDRLMLSELYRQEEQVCLVLRRSDRMPLQAIGNLEGLLGVTLDRLRETMDALFSGLDRPVDGADFWRKYENWGGLRDLCREIKMSSGQWLRLTVRRTVDGMEDLLIFHRITQERQRDEEYEACLRQAEEVSQFKTSFLFRVSHEIRTPMNGITGMLTLIRSKLSPDHPAVQYVDRADELSELLLSLINDILDMSRIEAGKVELEAAPFSLRAFGSKLCDMFSKTLGAKDVRCDVRFDGMTADWVVGGELRIGQAVINFLSNAVKFTSQGEVTVTFRQMLQREGTLDLMLRVHDTGIGMDPEFINRIFRPFEKEDASTTRRFGGTGLGMAISDQLVRLMGGQVVVESMKGQGSDFSVILSLPVADEAQAAQAESRSGTPEALLPGPHGRGQRDQRHDHRGNSRAEGRHPGCGRKRPGRGGALLLPAPGTYATILMDVQMPVMDGRAAARAIRALIAGLTAAAAAAGTAYIIQVYQSGQGFHPFQSDRELRNDQILFPDSDSASGLREDGDASDDSFWQEDGADDGTTPEGAQSAYLFGQGQPAPEGVPSGSVSTPAAPGDAQMNGTLPSGGNVYEITEGPEPGSTDLVLPGNLNGGTASGEGTGGGEEVLPGGLHPGTGGHGAERPALVSDHGPGPGTGPPLDGFPAQAGGQRPAVAGDHRPRSDDGDPPGRVLRSGLCGIFGPMDAGPAQSAPAPERAAVEHHPGGPAAEHLSPPRWGNGKRHRLPRRCGRADPRPPLRQGAAAGGASGPGGPPQRGQRRGPAHPRRSGKDPLSPGLCGRGL